MFNELMTACYDFDQRINEIVEEKNEFIFLYSELCRKLNNDDIFGERNDFLLELFSLDLDIREGFAKAFRPLLPSNNTCEHVDVVMTYIIASLYNSKILSSDNPDKSLINSHLLNGKYLKYMQNYVKEFHVSINSRTIFSGKVNESIYVGDTDISKILMAVNGIVAYKNRYANVDVFIEALYYDNLESLFNILNNGLYVHKVNLYNINASIGSDSKIHSVDLRNLRELYLQDLIIKMQKED